MTHFQIHELERRIAAVILKGFSPKIDSGDAIQAGHDVADLILSEYHIDPKPTGYEADTSMSRALESTLFGIDALSKQLNEFIMGRKTGG